MKIPQQIIDVLESIVGLYFSDVRHKERSVFILVDNLIETICKYKLKESGWEDNNLEGLRFYPCLEENGVVGDLYKDIDERHNLRNKMQHAKLAFTVDIQQCSDAIIGSLELIDFLWDKECIEEFPSWLICGLQIIKLYSKFGEISKRKIFNDFINSSIDWRDLSPEEETLNFNSPPLADYGFDPDKIAEPLNLKPHNRLPNPNEIIITVSDADHRLLLLTRYHHKIRECLIRISANYQLP